MILGFVLGIFASLVAWLAVNHLLRPDVAISKFISRSVAPSGDIEYRLKVQNRRRRREAIDVRFEAYAFVPRLRRAESNEIIALDVTGDELLGLRRSGRKIFYLGIDRRAVDGVRELLPEGAIDDVESLLRVADERRQDRPEIPRAEIRIWLAYTDSYSGVRSAKHLTYTTDDILSRRFDPSSIGPGEPSGAVGRT